MHVLKVVEERKWCPGNSSLQMLPSAFKLYVKWDFKRKIKEHSQFLKPWTRLRRSRLWLQLCGRLSSLPLVGYWNRELENRQVVFHWEGWRCWNWNHSTLFPAGTPFLGRMSVCVLTHSLYTKFLWLAICWEGSRWNSLLFDYDQRFESVLGVEPKCDISYLGQG